MTTPKARFDCIVIGAGIAGASVAAELAAQCRVLLLERERQPGYHTTGRSAALFTAAYGPPVIRALTRASRRFFDDPQSAFLDHPLLLPRGAVFVARPDQAEALETMQQMLGDAVVHLDSAALADRMPLLRDGYATAGLWDRDAADIDVHGLHQHYLKTLRARGGELRTGQRLDALSHDGEWRVDTRDDVLVAPIVVNAAGAWGDEIAEMAGLMPAGLVPKRRTALTVDAPGGADTTLWPMTIDVDEHFYLKPDAGKLLISPADATPSPPCDAQPDEMDIALCIDRIERAFDLAVRRIESKWAGLRTFLPDGSPMAGFDPDASGFFWLVGQGGYGIQSAPALARASAALIMDREIPADIADQGVSADALSRTGRERAA